MPSLVRKSAENYKFVGCWEFESIFYIFRLWYLHELLPLISYISLHNKHVGLSRSHAGLKGSTNYSISSHNRCALGQLPYRPGIEAPTQVVETFTAEK